MAVSVPKDLFDAALSEQIATGRYASGQAAGIVALLKKAEKELMDRIAESGKVTALTAARRGELLRDIRAMYNEAYAGAHDTLKSEMEAFSVHSGEVAAATLSSQLPVTFSTTRLTATQLEALVSKTPITVGEGKKLLFGELFDSYSKAQIEDITGAVRLGMVSGEGTVPIANRIKKVIEEHKIIEKHLKYAENLTRTITNSVGNSATMAVYRQNSNVVKGWTWLSTFDSKTCSACAKRSDKNYIMGDMTPPLHLSCRCFTVPILKPWAELGIDAEEFGPTMRASASGPVSSDTSYSDWLHTQSKAAQIEALGVQRQKLFEQGKMDFNSLVSANGRFLTLERLKNRK